MLYELFTKVYVPLATAVPAPETQYGSTKGAAVVVVVVVGSAVVVVVVVVVVVGSAHSPAVTVGAGAVP
jgi:hypothetical protein